MLTVNLRYKLPQAATSCEFQVPVPSHRVASVPSQDSQFAAAVLAYGMLLRNSQYAGAANWDWVVETASASKGDDPRGIGGDAKARHLDMRAARRDRRSNWRGLGRDLNDLRRGLGGIAPLRVEASIFPNRHIALRRGSRLCCG